MFFIALIVATLFPSLINKFELIVEKFAKEREIFNHYMENLDELNKKLEIGEKKAAAVADKVMARVRKISGFSS